MPARRRRARRRRARAATAGLTTVAALGLLSACGVTEEDRRAAEELHDSLRHEDGVHEVVVHQVNDWNQGRVNRFAVALDPRATEEELATLLEAIAPSAEEAGLDEYEVVVAFDGAPDVSVTTTDEAHEAPDDRSATPAQLAALLAGVHDGPLADAVQRLDLTVGDRRGSPGRLDVGATSPAAIETLLTTLVDDELQEAFGSVTMTSPSARLRVDDRPLDEAVTSLWEGLQPALALAPPELPSDLAVAFTGREPAQITVSVNDGLDVRNEQFTHAGQGAVLWPYLSALIDVQQQSSPASLVVTRDDLDSRQTRVTLLEMHGTNVLTDPFVLGWDKAATDHLRSAD